MIQSYEECSKTCKGPDQCPWQCEEAFPANCNKCENRCPCCNGDCEICDEKDCGNRLLPQDLEN